MERRRGRRIEGFVAACVRGRAAYVSVRVFGQREEGWGEGWRGWRGVCVWRRLTCRGTSTAKDETQQLKETTMKTSNGREQRTEGRNEGGREGGRVEEGNEERRED